MRRILQPIFFITFLTISFSSCVREVVVIESTPAASVSWDFWAGARNVEVDGEIFNDGNTFINGVELEISMFDSEGYHISSAFRNFIVNLDPQRIASFGTDIQERYVYHVEVRVMRIW